MVPVLLPLSANYRLPIIERLKRKVRARAREGLGFHMLRIAISRSSGTVSAPQLMVVVVSASLMIIM